MCTCCKRELPISEFFKDNFHPDGLRYECKQCSKEQCQKYREEHEEELKKQRNSFHGKYITYKSGAKRRGYDFNLTEEQFTAILNKPCMYCGSTENIGVDRLDNSKGYDVDNCISCCSMCNMSKRHHTAREYIMRCKAVAKNFGAILQESG